MILQKIKVLEAIYTQVVGYLHNKYLKTLNEELIMELLITGLVALRSLDTTKEESEIGKSIPPIIRYPPSEIIWVADYEDGTSEVKLKNPPFDDPKKYIITSVTAHLPPSLG